MDYVRRAPVHGAISVLRNAVDNGVLPTLSTKNLDPSSAVVALASIADILLLIDQEGSVQAAGFGSDTTLASELLLPCNRRWTDLLSPESVIKGRDLLATAVTGAVSRAREINQLGAIPGQIRPIRYVAIRHGDNGDILLIGRDLQPQAHLQRQLVDVQQTMERDYGRMRAVETRYRVLFQLGGTPMLIVDVGNRKVLEANSACLALFGLTAPRMTGRTVASLFDEHDAEALQGLLTTAVSAGEAKGVVLRAATGERHFELSAHLFRQEGASLLLLQARPVTEPAHGTANDVVVLPTLIERLPEGFVITDGDGTVMEANRTFLDLAELPLMASAIGKSLGHWLGRTTVDFGVLLSSLQDRGTIRGFSTILRGEFGAEEGVEVSAVKILDQAAPRIGFLIRTGKRGVESDHRAPTNLPRSVEQMKELVGNVPLKELVRETTDVIERLCIEAALELTNDNRASAAEMLGLSRQSLYSKLHRFGLGDLGKDDDT
jgi:transcriptional regulator PpsR